MLRAAVAYLLITLLFACPFMCMERVADASVSRGVDACHCTCGTDTPGSGVPDQPEEQSSDCLCQGAVTGSTIETQEVELFDGISWYAVVDTVPSNLTGDALLVAGSSLARHFPRVSSGRDICGLTCALLL